MNVKIKQSLENFEKSIYFLQSAAQIEKLDDLQPTGAVKCFEVCYELSWKLIQKMAAEDGKRINSPREAFQHAFQSGWIKNDQNWIQMIADRNLAVHTYDRETAKTVWDSVQEHGISEFQTLLVVAKTWTG